MYTGYIRQQLVKLSSIFLMFCLLLSSLSSVPVVRAQSGDQKTGGGGWVDTKSLNLPSVSYFDFEYLLLKQTVALWADGRGDVILERKIRNVDSVSGTDTTWYFDWYSGEYSNIRAWDKYGPLEFSISQSGTRIYITIEFRQPVLPNSTYDFSLGITIGNMAYGSGNDWEATWYTYPGFPIQEFVQGITLPSNSTIQYIDPTPTLQNLNYIEWQYYDLPAYWINTIDVYYTLNNNVGVPLFLQTAPETWAGDTYGNYPAGDTVNTISKWGCWMTSAAMIVEYWGQRSSPAFHTDPGTLNNWLRNNNGYNKSNGVVHTRIEDYANDNLVSLYYRGIVSERNDAILDDYLFSGNPVIIQVANSLGGDHFVVATGRSTIGGQMTYSINDPVYGITTLLDHYNNDYSRIILYSGTFADRRTLSISAHSPVELLVTDPIGRKSGYDPITDTTWDEIPNALYIIESIAPDDGSTTPPLEYKYLEVISPLDGNYNIDVIGTGQGSYEINTFASDWFGEISQEAYTGFAEDGSVDSETSYYSSYSGIGAPTVPFILRASANPNSAVSVQFTVKFSKPVTGVDKTDFTFTKTGGITGYSVTSISPSGGPSDMYTVTVATGKYNGTLRLDVLNNGSIQDGAGNPLASGFTSGEAYTIIKTYKSTLKSSGSQDGWIMETGEKTNKGGTLNKTATTLRLGDNAQKKQYRSILSFSTKGLPDNAVITKVTLKVKRQGILGGGNPVTLFQGFMVDMRRGFFGSSFGLGANDFQLTYQNAYKTYGPFKPGLVSGWYSINLTTGKAFINKLASSGGVTQVRLRFKLDDNNNGLANYLSLYSGNAPTVYKPQLIIEYYVP